MVDVRVLRIFTHNADHLLLSEFICLSPTFHFDLANNIMAWILVTLLHHVVICTNIFKFASLCDKTTKQVDYSVLSTSSVIQMCSVVTI